MSDTPNPVWYPDIPESLFTAVRAELARTGRNWPVTDLHRYPRDSRRNGFREDTAFIEVDGRLSFVQLDGARREFRLDFWGPRRHLVRGATDDLGAAVDAMHHWQDSDSVEQLCRRFGFLASSAIAVAEHPRVGENEARWRKLINSTEFGVRPEEWPVLSLAAAQPRLRDLYPLSLMLRLAFKWERSGPDHAVLPVVMQTKVIRCWYRVIDADYREIGQGYAPRAIELVLAELDRTGATTGRLS